MGYHGYGYMTKHTAVETAIKTGETMHMVDRPDKELSRVVLLASGTKRADSRWSARATFYNIHNLRNPITRVQ